MYEKFVEVLGKFLAFGRQLENRATLFMFELLQVWVLVFVSLYL